MAKSTQKKAVAERAVDLSDDVLESVRDRQQAVIEATRKFVDRAQGRQIKASCQGHRKKGNR